MHAPSAQPAQYISSKSSINISRVSNVLSPNSQGSTLTNHHFCCPYSTRKSMSTNRKTSLPCSIYTTHTILVLIHDVDTLCNATIVILVSDSLERIVNCVDEFMASLPKDCGLSFSRDVWRKVNDSHNFHVDRFEIPILSVCLWDVGLDNLQSQGLATIVESSKIDVDGTV